MKTNSLRKIAAVVYLMVSVLFIGQITTFADAIDESIKPVHVFNFDNDSMGNIIDTGSSPSNGRGYGANRDELVDGYNGEGKARYFNGTNDYLKVASSFKSGAKAFRFKVKKDPLTFSNKTEFIMSAGNTETHGTGYFVAIGADTFNDRGNLYPTLTARPETLYIVAYYGINLLNFEIQTPESICDGKWHDILFSWDGTTNKNAVKLYLDDMTTPVAQTTAASTTETNFSPTYIGSDASSSNQGRYFYKGYLDNVQFYDSAITTNSNTSSNLKAVGGDSKVDLTWDAVTNATSYTIKRATTAGGPYTTIASDITETSYTDTEVTNGITYYYVVSSVNAGVEITNSNEASVTPIAGQTPPTTEAKLKVVLEVAEALRLSVDDDLNVNTQMSWSSSDQTVATVNEKGIVIALAPGNTVITVKSADGSYTDYINVLVVENADDYRLAIDLRVGETARLTADDFTNTANITWVPMDSSIANVTSKGKVTALSKGLVLISAKDTEGKIIGRVYVRVRE
ncbi:Ig-like domain (group 2) [Lacrimispora sphenoides]|uniref:Ig-like domain-containing protein n=1 Tax=Lacrimispora sphenoides TaxID=29370 RepID=UPI0008BF502C|nr:Ig-like domain-containing protein [Lacrimispora sphenoides]SEU28624.1 Ig-like domain (group 2) [Lacrimispora sphenoides]